MIKYRRWIKILIMPMAPSKLGDPVVNYAKACVCDGWYLFGKFAIWTRENI